MAVNREGPLCLSSTHPSYARGRPLVLPIADDAFLPVVVSLQAKPPCDLACDCERANVGSAEAAGTSFPFKLVWGLTGSKPIP